MYRSKTGITLKDTGVRDEHGMMPMENIFSSPEKPGASSQKPSSSSNGKRMDNGTLTEEDMELTNSRTQNTRPPRFAG